MRNDRRAIASQRRSNSGVDCSSVHTRESGDHTPDAFDDRTSGGSSLA